jgi:hypothetical protein
MPPTVSVVIPTRNRAAMLPFAMRSVLGQSFADLELIVSDNASSDQTAEVVRSFQDDRIRYHHTGQSLPMHGSWAFATQQSTAPFVLFLPDDDVLLPEAVEHGVSALQQAQADLVCWDFAYYYHPTFAPRPERRNHLLFYPFDGQSRKFASRPTIERVLTGMPGGMPFPQMSNALHRRELLFTAFERMPDVHSAAAGDYATAVLLLGQVPSYLHLALPLTVIQIWENSLNISLNLKGESHDQKRRALAAEVDRDKLARLPLQLPLPRNLNFGNILAARAAAGPEVASMPWDPYYYFLGCYGDILALPEAEKAAALQAFQEALGQQELPLRARVQQELHRQSRPGLVAHARRLARQLVNRLPGFSRLELLLRPQLRRKRGRLVAGRRHGFGNILEASRCLAALSRRLLNNEPENSWQLVEGY